MPRSMLSCTSSSRCSRISRSRSPECAYAGTNSLALLFRGPQNPRNRAREPVPLAGLNRQLPPAFGGQLVEFGASIVLRGPLFGRDPSAFDEPVQCRIQRPLLDQQYVV